MASLIILKEHLSPEHKLIHPSKFDDETGEVLYLFCITHYYSPPPYPETL